MQAVSNAWKQAQRETLVPESYVRVELAVTDPEADADAASSANGELFLSDAASLVTEVDNDPRRYALPEGGLWLLDGQSVLIPDSPPYGRNGYVGSALCGADGFYTQVPTITISFSKVYDTILPGLTVVWGSAYGDYAARFRVTVYAGNTVVSQDEVDNDKVETKWLREITHFDKIVLEILRWSVPWRRPRIEKLRVGITEIFEKAELMSYRHSLRVDPLSSELPKMEISFQVKDLEGSYDPYNPSGWERYMLQRQRLTVRYGYDLDGAREWIKAGTFFLNGWDLPQNGIKAGFTARDLLEWMNGVYTGSLSGSLGDIIRRAFVQANLPVMGDGSVRWVVDPSLDAIAAPSGVSLDDNTLAEVVQYAANAGCCVMVPDREGRLIVAPLDPDAVTDYPIDQYNGYANAGLTLEKPLRSVDVNHGQYVLQVGSVGEDEPVTNPLISDERAPIVAAWVADFLTHRNVLSGSWRSDPRLDPLDRANSENRFGQRPVLITQIEYTYNGAFRGSYQAREGV